MSATYDRHRPFPARLLAKRDLAGPGSVRPTLHVALSIAGAGFDYQPGDVVAVYPHNQASVVDALLSRLALSGQETVTLSLPSAVPSASPASITLRQALTERRSLGAPPLRFLRAAIDQLTDEDEAFALEDLCEDGPALDAYLAERDLHNFLAEHPSLAFAPKRLCSLLPALQPRTYSIASSPRAHPNEVHLTVGIVAWDRAGRARRGVASAHFERMQVGDTLPLYFTASRHFRMPEDPQAPVVCIGPGTGIAPFRGFLQDRATAGGGPVWLLFGAQTRAHDFYYEAELDGHAASGALGRLDLAFSRDQAERIYVQHRLREAGDELWAWLERGAYLYLCGDASKMAPDVERTIVEIIDSKGTDGTAYVARLKDSKRYRRDVY